MATVSLGPEFRRGALDKEGVEAVGGVVTMRYGENPLAVIERVKEKIAEISPGLPQKTLADGRVSKVRIVAFYDRTDIIHETMDTLKEALTEELIVGVARRGRLPAPPAQFAGHRQHAALVDGDFVSRACTCWASTRTSCRWPVWRSPSATWRTWP